MNAMTARAVQAGASDTGGRQGIITAYDPNAYAVKVQIQPTGEETGWIPLQTQWAGNGWGLVAGPVIGAVVTLDNDSFNISNSSAGGQTFNDVDRPPPVPSSEFWIIHKTGSLIKLLNTGEILAQDKAGSIISMNGDGTGTATFSGGLTINANTQINGWLKVSGDISDQNGAHGTVASFRTTYNGHTHHENGTGSNTNNPNQQIT